MFAGTMKSFGQVGAQPSTRAPQELIGCDDYPLHPKAGIPYAYRVGNEANDPSNADGNISYLWWATKNPNFVDTVGVATANFNPDTLNKYNIASGELIATSSNYGAVGNLDSVVITWSPEILAATEYRGSNGSDYLSASYSNPTPTFVAVMATGTCTNNIQVFELNPLPSFTVDIAGIEPGATPAAAEYGDTLTQCVDIVRKALYNGTTIDMDYGTDTMYFEVIAANFVDKWMPHFTHMGGLNGDQTFDIAWAYAMDGFATPIYEQSGLASGAIITGGDSIYTNEPNTVDGVSIFVRIVIHNNTYASVDPALAAQVFSIAVDGQDATTQWDLVNETCVDPDAIDRNDLAYHRITPRPNVKDAPGENETIDDESNEPNEQILKNN